MSQYRILRADDVLEYLRAYPQAAKWLDLQASLEVRELSDGNLNSVFRVFERSRPERSLLLKQALPYLRVAGEGWPLSTTRAGFEARALEQAYRLAPGLVPEPYWFDAVMFVNVMEDLRAHAVIRRDMVNRTRFMNLGSSIGDYLARTLFGTSDFALETGDKKRLQASFANAELCQITEDLILTEPFEAALLPGQQNRNHFDPGVAAALEAVQADTALRTEVAGLKQRFMTCGQALLHGDLHTGSIMASRPDALGNADIRVIDPEFAFFGPMGFDIGLFVANLFLNASAQLGHAPDATSRREYREYLFDQARTCWSVFERDFRAQFPGSNSVSWRSEAFQNAFMLELLRDTCGFAGCEMIRRSVGFAHVLDVDSIPDDERRAEVLRVNLRLGSALIRQHHQVSHYADLESIAKEVIGQ